MIFKQVITKILTGITLLALTFSAWGVTLTKAAAADTGSEAARPVQQLLNPDGTLNLTTGYSGSLDIAGYSVSLDPLHGPVFSPALLASPGQ